MRSEYDFSKAKKGKTAKEIKILKTVRLDPEVVQWLEEESTKQGMGYQTFLNWFLRQAMSDKSTVEQRLEKLERAVFKKK
ncbi:BrnA antitoxin family protein [Bdellovibrio sp. HCB2-146]|uniref:BrnA antitoxin family protein n=1 Tax=Bdellovibrio sp. HCB2-146 TaxID=3394362 RepID=UPI0039BD3CD5